MFATCLSDRLPLDKSAKKSALEDREKEKSEMFFGEVFLMSFKKPT